MALFNLLFISKMIVSAVPYATYILLTGIIVLWNESEQAFSTCSESSFLKYRKLQVVEKLVNSCERNRIFPIIAMAAVMEIMGGFVAIKYHSSVETTHLVSLLTIVLLCLVFTVIVFGGAGSIYKKSCRWLITAKNHNQAHKTPSHRITYAVENQVRINFVNALTPLVVQHFCIIQTLNLLLLSYKP